MWEQFFHSSSVLINIVEGVVCCYLCRRSIRNLFTEPSYRTINILYRGNVYATHNWRANDKPTRTKQMPILTDSTPSKIRATKVNDNSEWNNSPGWIRASMCDPRCVLLFACPTRNNWSTRCNLCHNVGRELPPTDVTRPVDSCVRAYMHA